MKNYIGTDIPQKYYVGDNRVYKLYKGAALLWTSETPSGVTVTYNVTSTTTPTQIARDLTGFTKMSVDGGTPISPSSTYIFSTIGEHTVVWDLIEPVVPRSGFMYSGSSALPILYVEIGDGVTEIGDNAFFRTTMTGVTIPDSVTKIGEWAFASNQQLGSVSLSSGLTSIGTNAFSNCGQIRQLTIPESVTDIGSGAFSQTNIRDINIPSGVTDLSSTFSWCSELTGITFTQRQYPYDYIYLDRAFRHCHALVSYTTPADIDITGEYIFADCRSLTSLTISNAEMVENGVVSGCTGLTSLVLPDETQVVKGHIIKGCSNLTSVTIPNASYYSQTVINSAWSLQTVQFGNALLPSTSYAHNLDFVDFLDDVEVTEQIFQGCTSLTRIDVVVDGDLMINQSTTIPSGSFSSDLPANGTIYYYYKSASETDINSQAIADALVSAIGNGWTAVSGGIWNGTPAQ